MANQQQQMKQMMKQVQQMQADMAAAQDALNQQTVEGSAGGGMVKVVVTGAGEVQSVSIDPDVVDPADVEMLEDLVLAAVGDGLRRGAGVAEPRALAASPAASTSGASAGCSAELHRE